MAVVEIIRNNSGPEAEAEAEAEQGLELTLVDLTPGVCVCVVVPDDAGGLWGMGRGVFAG